MHPRNPYRTPPDFAALAAAYPALQPHVVLLPSGQPSIDFHDAAAQRCLTQALLRRDFGLALALPDDRLCPPVPNRLNYVLWVQDIVRACADAGAPVHGLDIGTGASAIYPLLACALEPAWRFTATELDARSLACARANVAANALAGRVRVVAAHAEGEVLAVLADEGARFAFTMCNPPFYSSAADVARSAAAKELGPAAVCTGADVEMITPGGEAAFVARILEESRAYGARCGWYTSTLGKLSSVAAVVARLRAHAIDNYAVAEFVQGGTRRWAVAWSWGARRLPDTLARPPAPALHALLPPHTTLRQPLAAPAAAVRAALAGVAGLRVRAGAGAEAAAGDEAGDEAGEGEGEGAAIVVEAARDTWSRKARRGGGAGAGGAGAGGAGAGGADGTDAAEPGPALVVEITAAEAAVEFRWVHGRERALFESLCSHLGRRIRAGLAG